MALKVCAVPGCPNLQAESKCPEHRSQYEKQRGTRQARGYGVKHDRLRAHWRARMLAGERVNCWRCGNPLTFDAFDLGHDDHDRSTYRGPECVRCNRATSGR